MQILKKINVVYFAFCLMLVPFVTAAAGPLDKSSSYLTEVNKSGNAGAKGNLPSLIGGLISVLLGSLGIVFVVFIIQAGILYMTAGGDTEKVKKAKQLIMQAVIGLIIVVSAYAISSFVIGQIQGATQAVQSGQ